MGAPLFRAADEANGVAAGDIEDDGCVRCPAHGRRIDVRTGACEGYAVQRVYATRLRPTGDGSTALEVDVSRNGELPSDAYNGGESPCVVRARRARAAVTPEDRRVRRRLEYESDDG